MRFMPILSQAKSKPTREGSESCLDTLTIAAAEGGMAAFGARVPTAAGLIREANTRRNWLESGDGNVAAIRWTGIDGRERPAKQRANKYPRQLSGGIGRRIDVR